MSAIRPIDILTIIPYNLNPVMSTQELEHKLQASREKLFTMGHEFTDELATQDPNSAQMWATHDFIDIEKNRRDISEMKRELLDSMNERRTEVIKVELSALYAEQRELTKRRVDNEHNRPGYMTAAHKAADWFKRFRDEEKNGGYSLMTPSTPIGLMEAAFNHGLRRASDRATQLPQQTT